MLVSSRACICASGRAFTCGRGATCSGTRGRTCAFTRSGARLFYCQPLYANPHGATLAEHRRAAVINAVREAGAFLLEDDYARDLTIDGTAPPPLAVKTS